jgi:hypothetical protein
MHRNDSRDSARSGKPEFGQPAPALVRSNEMYLWDDLKSSLGLKDHAVKQWIEAGLNVRNPGTKFALVWGGDVLAVIFRLTGDPENSTS